MADWAPDALTGVALEYAVRAQVSSPARTQAFATTLHGFFAFGSFLELIRGADTVTIPLPLLQINGTTLTFPAQTVTINSAVEMDIDSGDWDARIKNGSRFAITYDVGKTVGVVRVSQDIPAGSSTWTIGPIVWVTETIPALSGGGAGGGSCTLQITGAPATVAANGTANYAVSSTGTTSAGSYPANTAATVINHMTTTNAANSVTLAGVSPTVGWAIGPTVKMGNDPRGTNTPSYWNPTNTTLKSSNYWPYMLPWFVVIDLTGHTATNTRVQFRTARAYIKSKSTGQWTLGWSDNFGGASYEKSFAGGTNTPDVRAETDGGGLSVAPPLGNFLHHGWFGSVATINSPDVDCVFVTIQARLILDNPAGTDDRASAAFGVHVGADYYPWQDFQPETDALPPGYNPGVGLSRTVRITNDWQHINFATLSDGLDQDPGGGITSSAFTSSPPPLDSGGGTVTATCTEFQTWLVTLAGGGTDGTGFLIAPTVVSPGNYSLALNNAVQPGNYLLWAKCNDNGGCQDSYVTVPITITAAGGGGGGGTGSGTPPNITWTAGAPTSCTSTKWGDIIAGTGRVVNDQWQVTAWGLDGTIVQTVCIGPSNTQSNSFRIASKVPLNWPNPGGTVSEVKSYPLCQWGQPPGFPNSGQTNIPIRVGSIDHLWAGHKGVTVAVDNQFKGHLSHDMRLMDTSQVFANYAAAASSIWMELFVVDRTWRGYGAHPNGRAASRFRGQYTIGNIDWYVYIQPGASNTPQLIWMPVTLPCPVPFDMAPLFKWASIVTYNQLQQGPGTIFARGQTAASTIINPDKIFVSNAMGVEVEEGEIDLTVSTAYFRCNID